MNLPDAKATLTPRVAASDYTYFQCDLTDPAGRRRSATQTSNVFTRDWQGNEFVSGVLYCFCASSPTVGDDARLGFFNATGQPVVYTGQPVTSPGALTPIEQGLLAPPGVGVSLMQSLSFGLLVRCTDQPSYNDTDFDSKDFDSTAINPNDPLYDASDTSSIDYAQ